MYGDFRLTARICVTFNLVNKKKNDAKSQSGCSLAASFSVICQWWGCYKMIVLWKYGILLEILDGVAKMR